MHDFFDFMAEMRDPQLSHLYRTHPHFDDYPKYMKDALIENEIMQGRLKPKHESQTH